MTRAIRSVAHAVPSRAPGRGRHGVTLIEILVVIGIVGILLALTSAALQKTAEGQNVKASETAVFKLQQALDMEYERVADKCRNDQIPAELLAYCDGNQARAKAVWTAYNLRVQFPETFAEANAQVPINGIVFLKPPAIFAKVSGAAAGSPQDESGALLYMILAEKSVQGGGAMATAAEDLAARGKVTVTGGTVPELQVFTDAWKNSIGFNRWTQISEVQASPYVDPSKAAANANRDPLDPQNLVLGWSDTTKRGAMNSLLLFNGQNRMATVYSVGKNKPPTAADDILGFRLRKQGARGTITQ